MEARHSEAWFLRATGNRPKGKLRMVKHHEMADLLRKYAQQDEHHQNLYIMLRNGSIRQLPSPRVFRRSATNPTLFVCKSPLIVDVTQTK